MSAATRKEKRAALVRRRDFLVGRTKNHSGDARTYDKAELHALNWALQIIDAAEHENVLYELEQVPTPRPSR